MAKSKSPALPDTVYVYWHGESEDKWLSVEQTERAALDIENQTRIVGIYRLIETEAISAEIIRQKVS